MDRKENSGNDMQKPKGAKLEFVARITLPDGKVIEKTVQADGGIPSPEEFDVTNKENFLATFDEFERSVIEARDRLCEEVEESLSDELKKTADPKE
mgnify:CR=1 FL=1